MRLAAIPLVPGEASGPVFVLSEPLSFWGGFDASFGRIIDRLHPQVGASLGTAPSAIVLLTRDAIITVGAMVAAELYRKSCPIVLAREPDWSSLSAASRLLVSASNETASLTINPAI